MAPATIPSSGTWACYVQAFKDEVHRACENGGRSPPVPRIPKPSAPKSRLGNPGCRGGADQFGVDVVEAYVRQAGRAGERNGGASRCGGEQQSEGYPRRCGRGCGIGERLAGAAPRQEWIPAARPTSPCTNRGRRRRYTPAGASIGGQELSSIGSRYPERMEGLPFADHRVFLSNESDVLREIGEFIEKLH